jgi:AcrR family transcriptional regulator
MSRKPPQLAPTVVPRAPRADARRNREHLIAVAREAFTQSGAEVSLDEIAKTAGVGPGTLYRHFPTRGALLEAVYRTGVEELAAAANDFARTMPPIEALRAWLLLFVDYMAAKQIIAPALYALVDASSPFFASTSAQIKTAIDALVGRAVASGDLSHDIEPLDLLRAIAGIANVAPAAEWPTSAKRLVDILIQGSRPL